MLKKSPGHTAPGLKQNSLHREELETILLLREPPVVADLPHAVAESPAPVRHRGFFYCASRFVRRRSTRLRPTYGESRG